MDLVKKNIILMGDASVGKTSLIRRYVIDEFSDKYITTIGTKVTKKEIVVNQDGNETQLTMMIWDLIGQKGFRYTQSLSFRGMNGALLVSDLTRKDTLESLRGYWIPLILTITGPLPMIFLGNKVDLKDDAQFGLDEIKVVAESCEAFGSSMECYLTSAMTGENVEDCFQQLGDLMIKARAKAKVKGERYLMDKDEVRNLVDVLDHIITDFSEQFGGVEPATPMIKHQLEEADLELKKPTREGVERFIHGLANVEANYKSTVEVQRNKARRLELLRRF